MTLLTVGIGYYSLWKKGFFDPVPKQITVRESPDTRRRPPHVRRLPQVNPPSTSPIKEPNPDENAEPDSPSSGITLTPVDPFEGLVTSFDLPELDILDFVVLAEIPHPSEIKLLSEHSNIFLDGNIIILQDQPSDGTRIAELISEQGFLKFRWLENIPDEAGCALRNSLVLVTHNGMTHTFALRSPILATPITFDLTKSVVKVTASCQCPPSLGDLNFALLERDRLPSFLSDGAELDHMKVGDEATLWYTQAERAGTRISMEKIGRVARIEFVSRYRLPSGNEEPMAIGHMKSQFNKLVALSDQAAYAKQNIKLLRNRLKVLEARRKPLATSVGTLRYDLEARIQEARDTIIIAEELIANQPAVEIELSELRKVEAIAGQLHQTRNVPFRFFIIVQGHEIDIILGGTDPIENESGH